MPVLCQLFDCRFIPNDVLKHKKRHDCLTFSKEDHLDLLKFIGKMLAVAVNHKDVISFRLAHPILKMVCVLAMCIYVCTIALKVFW